MYYWWQTYEQYEKLSLMEADLHYKSSPRHLRHNNMTHELVEFFLTKIALHFNQQAGILSKFILSF